jgi:drug/metabolite transporter (DMT)-like permease
MTEGQGERVRDEPGVVGGDRPAGRGAVRFGMLMAAGACVLWGTVPASAKFLSLSGNVDPLGAALGRFAVAAVVLSALALGRHRHLRPMTRRDTALLFLLGLTGVFGLGLFVFTGARLTTSINMSVLLNANPIIICLLAALLGERITRRRTLGTVLGLAGCMLVIAQSEAKGGAEVGSVAGDLCGAGAGLSWAIYTIASRGPARRYGAQQVTAAAVVVGTVMLAVAAAAIGIRMRPSLWEALVMVYLGVLPTAGAFVMWAEGLRRLDASAVGPFQYIAPIVSAVLGPLLFGERLTLWFLAGAAATAVGIHLSTARHPA